MAKLTLPVRCYRLGVDEGQECVEKNFSYAEREWELATDETALVLVDCWDKHYVVSHEERSGQVIRERIAPALQACRQAGITIVHAPSPGTARAYPQWLRYAGDRELGFAATPPPPDWPPEDFRSRKGDYAIFDKPPEPARDQWVKEFDKQRRIVQDIAPVEQDFVIATGEQLHRLLRDRRILHLLYCGFAANMCVPGRDYGTRAMKQRGYNIILLRDCTAAIEAAHTFEQWGLTEAFVLECEMTIGHTTTSQQLIAACEAERND